MKCQSLFLVKIKYIVYFKMSSAETFTQHAERLPGNSLLDHRRRLEYEYTVPVNTRRRNNVSTLPKQGYYDVVCLLGF